jgi:predicted  nucleic acid-binding Zn-ribbon protein
MARDNKKNVADLKVEEKLKNLYKLQTLLSEIDKIRTIRGELPEEVRDLEDEIEGLTTRIENINNDIITLKKEVSERQANIKENEMNIERFKTQIDNVRNNREYDNLSKQIEYAELDIQLNEKKINEAKERIKAKEEEALRNNTLVNDRRADLDAKRVELEEVTKETREEEEKLKEQAQATELTIETRLLTAFKRIRKNCRNGLGVVYVQRDACGGCFNKIPPQRQLDIRMRKKIIVCEYCGRIMIDPELAGVQVTVATDDKPKRRRSVRKTDE